MVSKIWHSKKQSLIRELDELIQRSAVLSLLGVKDGGAELRAMLQFDTVTLVRPFDGAIRCQGPVVVGLRYHEQFLAQSPIPWELVSVLSPHFVFHPNIDPAGALCVGHPQPAIRFTEIVHMTWAALTFNLRVADTVEWHGLNPAAAAFVRANQHRMPLTECGLYEAQPLRDKEFAF